MARREEAAASGAAEAEESQSWAGRTDGPSRRQRHERAGHRRRRAHDVRQARRRAGELAPGGPARVRPDDAARADRRRPRARRRRHRRVREPGGRAEHQHRPQRLGLRRAAPGRAGHDGRPPVRLVAAGRALRRGRGGRGPLRPGHRVRRRGHEPGPAGLQRAGRDRAVPALLHGAGRRPPLDAVPGQPGPGRPLRDHAGGDGRLRPRVAPPGRRELGQRALRTGGRGGADQGRGREPDRGVPPSRRGHPAHLDARGARRAAAGPAAGSRTRRPTSRRATRRRRPTARRPCSSPSARSPRRSASRSAPASRTSP